MTSIQVPVRDWNFPKETKEEGNGRAAQPAGLCGCKHAWVRSKSKLCAGTLHSPLSPAVSPAVLSLCQHKPTRGQEGPDAPQKQLLPLQSLWLILSCSISGTRRMQPCKASQYLSLPVKTNKWGKQTPWRDFLFLQTNTLRTVQKRLIKFQNPCANTLIMILKLAVNQGSFQGGKCLIQKSVWERAAQPS